MNEIMNINGIECYEKDGTAYLRLETVARGLGFTDNSKGTEYIRWSTVYQYLKDIGFSQEVAKNDFIPENIFYRLAMKAKNEAAEAFQALVADKIIPSIRKHGAYIAPELKKNMAEARLLNARARVSNQWMRLAQQVPEAEYKQICASYASAVLAGSPVIPLPPAGEKHLSAHEVGKLLGVSANQIGRIANQNGLKTEQYGKWFHDKSPHSVRQVEVFMYNSSAVDRFRELLHK